MSDTEYLTIADAAAILNRSPRTIWSWIANGVRGVKLGAKKIGWQWVTTQRQLDEFSDACTNPPVPAKKKRGSDVEERVRRALEENARI